MLIRLRAGGVLVVGDHAAYDTVVRLVRLYVVFTNRCLKPREAYLELDRTFSVFKVGSMEPMKRTGLSARDLPAPPYAYPPSSHHRH